MKKLIRRGRPRQYKEDRRPYTIRENPKLRAKLVKKYGTLQAAWNEFVKREYGK